MKYLTNKKLWAAIIGLVTAFGTLMVTLDEVKASSLPINTTIYSELTYPYGATVTVATHPFYGGLWWKTAVMKKSTGSLPCEIWLVLKRDKSDISTWKNVLLYSTTTPHTYSGVVKPLWTLGRALTLSKNVAEVFWHPIEYDGLDTVVYEQIQVLIDTTVDGKLSTSIILPIDIP